jgi:ribosome maturation factor RimP
MRYTLGSPDPVFDSVKAVVEGLAMNLVELSVFQRKGNVQVRAVIYKDVPQSGVEDCGDGKEGVVGIDDCARVHRAIIPRLELAFPKQDIYVEVSSPGVERQIKDGSEFAYYLRRPVSCYRTDISDWISGILMSASDTDIVIKGKNGMISLSYGIIGKAKLASFASVTRQEEGAAV